MKDNLLKPTLPLLHSFEQYEIFKKEIAVLNQAAKEIIYHHQLPDGPLSLFSEGTNIVFGHNDSRIIKIFPPFHETQFKAELLVLSKLANKLSVATPQIEHTGNISGWPYIVMNRLEGILLETLWNTMDHANKIVIIRELGLLIREVHQIPIDGLESIDCHWKQFMTKQLQKCINRHRSHHLPEILIQQIPDYLSSIKISLQEIKKPVLLTGEYTPMNFLVKQISGTWHIHGLIDFGDAMLGLAEYDLLGPAAFLIQGNKQLLKEFLISYGYPEDNLSSELSHKLTALMLLHQYSNLNVQIRIKNWQNQVNSIKDLENLVWGFK